MICLVTLQQSSLFLFFLPEPSSRVFTRVLAQVEPPTLNSNPIRRTRTEPHTSEPNHELEP